jgi:hypothetical protein
MGSESDIQMPEKGWASFCNWHARAVQENYPREGTRNKIVVPARKSIAKMLMNMLTRAEDIYAHEGGQLAAELIVLSSLLWRIIWDNS